MKVDEVVMTVFWVLFITLFTALGASLGEGVDKVSSQILGGYRTGAALVTVPLAWVGFSLFWRNLTRR